MSRSKQVDRPDRRCASGRVVAEEEVELSEFRHIQSGGASRCTVCHRCRSIGDAEVDRR